MTNPIYLDYSASTPVDPRVIEAMLPFFNTLYGNPSSQHRAGWAAQHAVDKARKSLIQLLNADQEREIIFTSGASEANTLALVGMIQALQHQNPDRPLHAITSVVEHKSVLETFAQLKEMGVEVSIIPTNSAGQVEVSTLKSYLKSETVLMSFMWANNEVGSLNPMEELSALAKENNICFHSDATQACGKLPIDLKKTPVDFLSLSAHKMYGPKGVGALYRRFSGHHPAFALHPQVRGGGQEYGLRAGTLNTSGIVGLGLAAELAKNEFLTQGIIEVQNLTQYLLTELQKLFPKMKLNGSPSERLPGHLHLSFPEIRWDQWLPRMSHLCVSTASACNSESSHGSHVLQALGFQLAEIHSSLRISLGKFTTQEELDAALQLFQMVHQKSPSATLSSI